MTVFMLNRHRHPASSYTYVGEGRGRTSGAESRASTLGWFIRATAGLELDRSCSCMVQINLSGVKFPRELLDRRRAAS
jgi:hypothetical protein